MIPDVIQAVLDFVLYRKLARFKCALYTVSVCQSEVLPPTSFRLCLTTDALVFLTVPTAKSVAELHRQVITHPSALQTRPIRKHTESVLLFLMIAFS